MHSADTPAAEQAAFRSPDRTKTYEICFAKLSEILARKTQTRFCFAKLGRGFASQNSDNAGWSSPVARQAHNLKAAGSNPAPATKHTHIHIHAKRPAAAGLLAFEGLPAPERVRHEQCCLQRNNMAPLLNASVPQRARTAIFHLFARLRARKVMVRFGAWGCSGTSADCRH